ncbi:hypothetical protein PCE1_002967 [Barthelona sp. PCE]
MPSGSPNKKRSKVKKKFVPFLEQFEDERLEYEKLARTVTEFNSDQRKNLAQVVNIAKLINRPDPPLAVGTKPHVPPSPTKRSQSPTSDYFSRYSTDEYLMSIDNEDITLSVDDDNNPFYSYTVYKNGRGYSGLPMPRMPMNNHYSHLTDERTKQIEEFRKQFEVRKPKKKPRFRKGRKKLKQKSREEDST